MQKKLIEKVSSTYGNVKLTVTAPLEKSGESQSSSPNILIIRLVKGWPQNLSINKKHLQSKAILVAVERIHLP